MALPVELLGPGHLMVLLSSLMSSSPRCTEKAAFRRHLVGFDFFPLSQFLFFLFFLPFMGG